MNARLSARRLLALGALLFAGILPADAAPFAAAPRDLQAEARAAGAAGQRLAVFLTLPDCPGCREMERTVFAAPAVAKALAGYRTLRVDIAGEAPLTDPAGRSTTPGEFARRLRAVATPSFAFFDGRGQVLYRYTGTLDAEGFRALARYVARADYERQPFAPPAARTAALAAEPPAATLPRQPRFALHATDGRLRTAADFRGKVVALAVGYTSCPDVCPTTLAELKHAVETLPAARRGRVQLLFATLDPERDSLALLAEYAAAFAPAGGRPLLGLRGDAAQTAALIRELQLVADKRPSATMGYTLDHTAGVFLLDAAGRLRGLAPYGQPVEQLVADLDRLTRLP